MATVHLEKMNRFFSEMCVLASNSTPLAFCNLKQMCVGGILLKMFMHFSALSPFGDRQETNKFIGQWSKSQVGHPNIMDFQRFKRLFTDHQEHETTFCSLYSSSCYSCSRVREFCVCCFERESNWLIKLPIKAWEQPLFIEKLALIWNIIRY